MHAAPAELMKEYVNLQNFSRTSEIMEAMKEMFRDVIQQVMQSELDSELGFEKSQRGVCRAPICHASMLRDAVVRQ